MKKLSILYLAIALIFSFSCQENAKGQVPEEVKATFKAKYPGENDPDWHKDDHGNFESNFKIDGTSYRADFRPDGSWIETETSIDAKDLPKVIRDIIKDDFDDDEITEVEKVEHHSKGTFYDVEFKKKGKNKDVEFSPSGKRLN